MSNTPSLLPCPFCGKTHSLIVGAASETWDADEHGPYPHTESYAVFCDASTDGRRGGCGGTGGYRLTKDEAIEAWNRRTPQPVVREPLTDENVEAASRRAFPRWWYAYGFSLCGGDPHMQTPQRVYAMRGFMGGFESGYKVALTEFGITQKRGD